MVFFFFQGCLTPLIVTCVPWGEKRKARVVLSRGAGETPVPEIVLQVPGRAPSPAPGRLRQTAPPIWPRGEVAAELRLTG
jgi:hypothetical protein